ncbi:hypothetical protein MMPV_000115 [Pyropia vietnamensis]
MDTTAIAMEAAQLEAALEASRVDAALEGSRREAALEASRREAALEASRREAALHAAASVAATPVGAASRDDALAMPATVAAPASALPLSLTPNAPVIGAIGADADPTDAAPTAATATVLPLTLAADVDGAGPAQPSASEVCAICYETPVPLEVALLPTCSHSYCASCILSWASARPLPPPCPLCKNTFTSLLVRRSLDGTPLALPPPSMELFYAEEPLALLLRAPWVYLTPVAPPSVDIASAFVVGGPPSLSVSSESGTVPAPPPRRLLGAGDAADLRALREEAEAEAAEAAFWLEEESRWNSGGRKMSSGRTGAAASGSGGACSSGASGAGGASSRSGAAARGVTLGNRRWGAGGFVRAGHSGARVVPPPVGSHGKGKGKGKARMGSEAASPSTDGAGSSTDRLAAAREAGAADRAGDAASAGGSGTKKIKGKGKARAKAAAREAAREAAKVGIRRRATGGGALVAVAADIPVTATRSVAVDAAPPALGVSMEGSGS